MRETWTWPAYVAVLLGGLLFLACLIPLLAYQVRRYGQLNFARGIGAAALAIYLVAVVAYTLLPFPTGQWCQINISPGAELVPFHSFDDIARETSGYSWSARLRSIAFLQVAFNVLLFVPWGVFARRFFRMSWFTAVLSGFAASVMIEVTQYTGVFGMVGCAYRVADVDDVIANTTGVALGVLIAPLVLFWMPSVGRLQSTRLEPRPISWFRRIAAMAADLFFFQLCAVVATITLRLGLYFLDVTADEGPSWWDPFLPLSIAFLLVVIWPAILPGGASWGQRMMWLTPWWDNGYRRGRALLRVMTGTGLYGFLLLAAALPEPAAGWWNDFATGAARWLILVAFLWATFDRSRAGMSFRIAGAQLVDARAPRLRRITTPPPAAPMDLEPPASDPAPTVPVSTDPTPTAAIPDESASGPAQGD